MHSQLDVTGSLHTCHSHFWTCRYLAYIIAVNGINTWLCQPMRLSCKAVSNCTLGHILRCVQNLSLRWNGAALCHHITTESDTLCLDVCYSIMSRIALQLLDEWLFCMQHESSEVSLVASSNF